ncbi:uncharacterized protein [Penaeus vannamei]|uniref:uncharacterized protein isoform X2 n=1 Tax=Penaeus vannamei TaxID=6689 RepID=UPI00387F521F
MDKYPGYKGGGLWDLELDQPLAWLPAEIARLSAPRQGHGYDSSGNGGFSTHNSPWAEHGQGSMERNLTQNTDGSQFYGYSFSPPTDLTKLKEVYATILSCMEKKMEAREVQMMDSGELCGGPVRSVDVHRAWEDARQGLREFKDETDINRPMICMDQDGGLCLKQETALDFGRTMKEQYQPPPTTWNRWNDALELHTTINSNGSFGGDCTIACSQDSGKVEQEDDCVMNTEERVEHNEKQRMNSSLFPEGSNSTPWEHLLYEEEKNHGEFKTATKKRLGCSAWDVSYPASTPVLESSQMLKKKVIGTKFCGFCKSNGATAKSFLSHPLRNDFGKLVCPVLRSYTCPYCGATGDAAHTLSYCPSKRQPHDSLPLAVKLKNTMRNASSVRRFNH